MHPGNRLHNSLGGRYRVQQNATYSTLVDKARLPLKVVARLYLQQSEALLRQPDTSRAHEWI